jgi:hypothetical protein
MFTPRSRTKQFPIASVSDLQPLMVIEKPSAYHISFCLASNLCFRWVCEIIARCHPAAGFKLCKLFNAFNMISVRSRIHFNPDRNKLGSLGDFTMETTHFVALQRPEKLTISKRSIQNWEVFRKCVTTPVRWPRLRNQVLTDDQVHHPLHGSHFFLVSFASRFGFEIQRLDVEERIWWSKMTEFLVQQMGS